MKKIAIIASADLPIPAVKGGAIETGIDHIINENEKYGKVMIDVFSYFDEMAYDKSKKYKNTKFYYFNERKSDYYTTIFIKGINKILSILKVKKNFNFRPNFTKFVGGYLNKNKYDAILIKNAIKYILPLKKYTNDPIYLQLHNDFFNSDTPNCEKIAKSCSKIIANSEYIKKRILTIKCLTNNDVLINKNCLDDRSFNVASAKEISKICDEYNIDKNSKIILFSGRLVPQKGIKELLLAVSKFPTSYNYKLLIVGNKWFSKNIKDSYLKELEQISSSFSEKVIFTGYVSHDKINILNTIADVAVIPSIWEEPAGRVVLEAEAVGTPVIISDSGGMNEYVNSKSAIVIKRGKSFVNELSTELFKLLNDEHKQKKMGEEGIKFSKKFNSKHYYEEILEELNI